MKLLVLSVTLEGPLLDIFPALLAVSELNLPIVISCYFNPLVYALLLRPWALDIGSPKLPI